MIFGEQNTSECTIANIPWRYCQTLTAIAKSTQLQGISIARLVNRGETLIDKEAKLYMLVIQKDFKRNIAWNTSCFDDHECKRRGEARILIENSRRFSTLFLFIDTKRDAYCGQLVERRSISSLCRRAGSTSSSSPILGHLAASYFQRERSITDLTGAYFGKVQNKHNKLRRRISDIG